MFLKLLNFPNASFVMAEVCFKKHIELIINNNIKRLKNGNYDSV